MRQRYDFEHFDLVFRRALFEKTFFDKNVKTNSFGKEPNKQNCLRESFFIKVVHNFAKTAKFSAHRQYIQSKDGTDSNGILLLFHLLLLIN